MICGQHRNTILMIVKVVDLHLMIYGLNPRVFGSVVHGNDTNESDLDILVDRAEGMALMDIGKIRYELRVLLGVPVDV